MKTDKTAMNIIRDEIDRQVGLYDPLPSFSSGVGEVIDQQPNRDYAEVYCGFSHIHRIKHNKNNIKGEQFAKEEWRQGAEDVIEELRLANYTAEISWLSHNGFNLQITPTKQENN